MQKAQPPRGQNHLTAPRKAIPSRMKLFSRTLRVGILGLALTLLNCQQLMDLLDEKNKVDDTAASTNTSLDTPGNWTILVYLDADNNLEGAGVQDVNEMILAAQMAGGGLNGNRVYVMIDRIGGYSGANLGAPLSNNTTGTYVFEVNPTTGALDTTAYNTSVPDNVLPYWPTTNNGTQEVNMGHQKTLQNFLIWGLNKAKSNGTEYVYLDIWDHGAGWGGGAYGGNAVAWDDTDGHDALTIKEIQDAITYSYAQVADKKVTILGFDACYMGTFENAYSFKNYASILVGSEEVEPGAGWQYTDWLPRAKTSPRDVAKSVVTTFKASYTGSGEDVTLAAYDLSKVSGVTSALEAFLNKIAALSPTAISGARQQSQSYNNDLSVDFYDFVDKVNIAESAALKNMINSLMVAEAHTAGGKVNGSRGVTIYFPASTSTYDSYNTSNGGAYAYTLTDFAKATRWDDFIGGKLTGAVAVPTEPGDATCGAESNDTAGTAIQFSSVKTCTGYVYSASDVDIYRFSASVLGGGGTINIILSNIPAGADFDVMLFNTDVSPSAPIAAGVIGSGNATESFTYNPANGVVVFPNQSITCTPGSGSTYEKQGLCYGSGISAASSTNFYIVVVGKNNSYNQTGKYTLQLALSGGAGITIP